MTITTTRAAGTAYVAPDSKADVLAEALGCIVTGRPLPEKLRPPTVARTLPPPATVEEGIARILSGPAS